MNPFNEVKTVVATLVANDARTATKYLGPAYVVRATRRVYGAKRRFSRTAVEIILTMGRPNHAERRFIARCKKAGESFLKKVQLKFPPKRKTRR